mgnify:CR=1 FL=1|tara:strand:+ start:443 stop:1684 length:1242 start_codon:yes stop_codon:yes gene_type:complete
MKTFEHPLITKNTERVDAVIETALAKYDIDNQVLYGEDDTDYYKALYNDIEENGIKNPPILYDDNTIKSGHTRIKIMTDLGHDTIPIQRSTVKKPKRGYKNMMSLMMENQTRPSDYQRQYNQIKTAVNAYELDTGEICTDTTVQNTICPAVQMSFNMYKQLRALELNPTHGYSKFVKVLKTNGDKLSPGRAYTFMLQDIKKAKNKKVLNQSKILDELINKNDVVYSVNVVSNVMSQLESVSFTGRDGEQVSIFDNVQQNVLGGISHEVFTNAITHSINHKYGKMGEDMDKAFAKASTQQKLEDIEIPFLQGAIEVKTCIIKDGNKLKYTTRTPKNGYYLLLGFTPDYEDVYCSYGYLDETVWNKGFGATPSHMTISELQKSDMEDFAGKLKLDKKTGNVHCIPVTLGSILDTY